MEQMRTSRHRPRSIREIEAAIEADRAALGQSLNDVRDALPKAAARSVLALGLSGGLSGTASRAIGVVRAYPLATALIGLGVGMVIFSRRPDPEPSAPLAGTKVEAYSRWEDDGGPVAPLPDHDDDWMDEADRLRSRASGLLGQIEAAVKSGLKPAAELVRSRAEIMSALTVDVRKAMGRGLEGLSQSARDTALAAREAAYIARVSAGRTGAEVVQTRPLLVGGGLAAVGAAVASAIPTSRIEASLATTLRKRALTQVEEWLAGEGRRARDLATSLVGDSAHPRSPDVPPQA